MNQKMRNVALVAHVDHGKTTLVDCLLKASGVQTQGAERAMDSIDQERERGITIRSKAAAVEWQGVRINLIDTPGHADFGGEVERVMGLVDGVLLLVDAAEGPMPQTSFVLRKALEANCQPVVVINKIDRPDRRPEAVIDEVFDLLVALGATDEQLDFTPIYTSAKEGWVQEEVDQEKKPMSVLLECILRSVPEPKIEEGDFTFQVANLSHDNFVGRVALGRVFSGVLQSNQSITRIQPDGTREQGRVTRLTRSLGLSREPIEEAHAGDIVEIAGFPEIGIGDTLTLDPERDPLPPLTVEEPTLSVLFRVNDGPFSQQEGKALTGRELRERLERELLDNVALRFEDTDRADTFKVSGRGLLHLSVFIETMRREGSEFLIGPPRILKQGNKEPWEELVVETPETSVGKIVELINLRRGMVEGLENREHVTRIVATIPARGLIGMRTRVLNLSRGEATFYHIFKDWRTWADDFPTRNSGSLISIETGQVNAYALDALDDRGTFFVEPPERTYIGMIIGESNKDLDVDVNPCKARKTTNMRSQSADRTLKFSAKRLMTLEDSLEFVADDEWVEVTPKSIRLRKDFLDANTRKVSKRR